MPGWFTCLYLMWSYAALNLVKKLDQIASGRRVKIDDCCGKLSVQLPSRHYLLKKYTL